MTKRTGSWAVWDSTRPGTPLKRSTLEDDIRQEREIEKYKKWIYDQSTEGRIVALLKKKKRLMATEAAETLHIPISTARSALKGLEIKGLASSKPEMVKRGGVSRRARIYYKVQSGKSR